MFVTVQVLATPTSVLTLTLPSVGATQPVSSPLLPSLVITTVVVAGAGPTVASSPPTLVTTTVVVAGAGLTVLPASPLPTTAVTTVAAGNDPMPTLAAGRGLMFGAQSAGTRIVPRGRWICAVITARIGGGRKVAVY